MKQFNVLAIFTLATLVTLSGAAMAGEGNYKAKLHNKAHHSREGFTRDVTQTGPNGTKTKHTVQTPTENGFNRVSTVTNGKGETATRETNGVYDPATKTWSKTSNRTNFDGSTASKSSTTTRTDDGYTRESSMTNRKGTTINRTVDASYDKATHSMSKDISVTKTKAGEGTSE